MEKGKRYTLKKSIFSSTSDGIQVLWLEGDTFKVSSTDDEKVYISIESYKVMISMEKNKFSEYFEELK